jgi:hypothetical protein
MTDWERIAARLADALRSEMGDGRQARPSQWLVESYEALNEYQTARVGGPHT